MFLWFISVFFLFLKFGNGEDVIRQTQYGLVNGEIRKSRAEGSTAEYYYFGSVPYARPPIGALRFQDPLPPIPWSGVLNTTDHNTTCTQLDNIFIGPNVLGSEDCLYLEVSVPILKHANHTKKMPVMVWLHGGTFIFSGVNDTGPDYFMEEPVVLVAVDYRLNVFGFLSTLDENAPGNAGLKDQLLALTWIKNNIEYFGGDSNKVTIFGCSAGGSSVQLHMYSPKSRGLFHRAISQSGSPLNPWSFQKNPLAMVRKLASGFGINTTDNKILIQELQKVSFDKLIRMIVNPNVMGPSLLYTAQPFSVSIETPSEEAFLSTRPYKLIESGKVAAVPYMMGYTTEEASFPYEYVAEGAVDLKMYDENPSLLVPVSMNVPRESPCHNYTIQKIGSFYFRNASFADKENWLNYTSQDFFIRGILKSAEMVCQKTSAPIYFYQFSFVGHKSVSFAGGASHYSEVGYLLYPKHPHWNAKETETEVLHRKRLVRLWVNFAYSGNPTPYSESLLDNVIWPTYCTENTYLDIGKTFALLNKPNRENLIFWDKIIKDCGYPPYYTY